MNAAKVDPRTLPMLTLRQAQALQAILSGRRENGVSPTIREICKVIGVASPNGAMCHLRSLRRKGWLDDVEPGDVVARALMPLVDRIPTEKVEGGEWVDPFEADLDLDALEAKRQSLIPYTGDLMDFYAKNWHVLVAEITRLRGV